MLKNNVKDFVKYFEIVAFIYFFIGIIILFLKLEFLDVLINFYSNTFLFMFIAYLIFGCMFYKHRSYLMNIIDGLFCFGLTFFYPFPSFNIYIYDFNKYLYYFLGGCFSFLPLIFCVIDKEKIAFFHIFRTVTRIFMIIFAVFVILLLKSCGVD